jgi:hypothetical protein
MQFTHLAGRKPIANYEADVMPHVGFSGGAGNSGGACRRDYFRVRATIP